MLKLVISFHSEPESLQRQIAKMYNDTLITQTFTFSGNSTFSLERAVSMDPIEKLKVTINDAIQQHFYDFTLDGNPTNNKQKYEYWRYC